MNLTHRDECGPWRMDGESSAPRCKQCSALRGIQPCGKCSGRQQTPWQWLTETNISLFRAMICVAIGLTISKLAGWM